MKPLTQHVALFVSALLVASLLAGCAAVKATRQPGKRDMSVLLSGVPRNHVIAEFGAPTYSEERNGAKVDVFSFKQGYTKTNKAARAMIHGAADVATLGLWEVVGLPAETLADGTDVKIEVYYNLRNEVDRVIVIEGEKAVHPPRLLDFARRGEKSAANAPKSPPALPDHEPEAIIASDGELRVR